MNQRLLVVAAWVAKLRTRCRNSDRRMREHDGERE
jgi:hypothetical protein